VSGRPDSPSLQWTGVVLAGGRSQRFGGVDKTRLPLGGRTLLQRAIDALVPVTTRRLVVGGVPGRSVETVPDRFPGAGPLGGILTALDAIDTSHALLLAVDLPFISGSLLEDLQRAGTDAAVAFLQHADGRLALCLSVRRDCAPRLHEAWARGARRVRDLGDLAPAVSVPVDAVTSRGALWNVNDPLTYARALEMTEHDCPAC
jgi:molybdopterin-guanine dinucleotide biosynthesis protein A